MSRTPSSILGLFALCMLLACGGGVVETAPARATRTRSIPDAEEVRHQAIDELGRRAWSAMAAGDPERLMYDDLALRTLLDSGGATRMAARRISLSERIGPTADFASLLATAEYAGVCLQGARAEEGGGVLGLNEDGWVFDRVLLIGRRPSGRRIAAWIEGLFVFSDVGFYALDLERIEEPRWEHSDLEIAPCDLSIRNDLPEIAR